MVAPNTNGNSIRHLSAIIGRGSVVLFWTGSRIVAPFTPNSKGKTMRYSNDEYRNGLLWNGFDYTRQAWIKDGKYVRCGHPESMACGCVGREFEGETVANVEAKTIR
jgi:hypothetical protein